MFAGIETGGTKTVCAVGSPDEIVARTQVPTGADPQHLIAACAEFIGRYPVEGLGLGSFGPFDTDPDSPKFGHVTTTPKPGWADADIVGQLQRLLPDVPIAITLDVSAAALGELHYGAGRGVSSMVYVTIGTGIGAGVVVDGRLATTTRHPEAGHMLIPTAGLSGICPYHSDCLEGLASGPALAARAGRPAQDLPDDHPVWGEQASLVARGLHNLALTYMPQRVVMGGGVGSREVLHRLVPALWRESLAGYMPVPDLRSPELGTDAGVIGALRLARDHSQG